MRFTELLVDVDRWDRAHPPEQDRALEEIAKELDGFEWVSTQTFRGRQMRPRTEACSACGGMGGSPMQSGNSDFPDCSTCNNYHDVIVYRDAEVEMAHRVGVFRHRQTGQEFVLVPGRMEIASCLVARDPQRLELANEENRLRKLTRSETRHIVMRAGAYDLAFDDGAWDEHPFGLRKTDVASLVESQGTVHWGLRPKHHPDRLACTIAALEAAQASAYHALADELGPIDRIALPRGCLARTQCATADPPRGRVHAMAFSRDGRWLATAGENGRDVRVWDVTQGRPLSRLELSRDDDTQRVHDLSFSPDHLRLLVATTLDLEIFELTGQSLARIGKGLPTSRAAEGHPSLPGRRAQWLANGDVLLFEAIAKTKAVALSLVDAETGEVKRSAEWEYTGESWGLEMAVSSTKHEGMPLYAAVSTRRDEALEIWDVERWEVVRRIPLSSSLVHLAIGGDTLFLSAREIRAYRISTDASFNLGDIASSGFPDIAASPDGTRIAWVKGGGVAVCNVASRRSELLGENASTTPIAFSSDGKLCATGTSYERMFAAIWPVT